jgi:FkbM family methyltransferase
VTKIGRIARGIALTAVGLVVLIILTVAVWVAFTEPVDRTRSFARLFSAWTEQPFPSGERFLLDIRPLLYSTGIVRPVRFEVEPKISLLLDPVDVIDRYVLLTGSWEHELWNWMGPNLPVGGTFIDVGAHIGSHTLRAAKLVGEQGRVIAVEPNPIIAARLRDNVAASGWSNIHVQEAACGEIEGKLRLYAGSDVNSGTASLSSELAGSHGGGGNWFEVAVLPLDQILRPLALQRIDIIKVDTEGAETIVLRGGEASIRKYRPVLMLETVDGHLRKMNSSLAELESLLSSLNYRKGRYDEYNSEWIPVSK